MNDKSARKPHLRLVVGKPELLPPGEELQRPDSPYARSSSPQGGSAANARSSSPKGGSAEKAPPGWMRAEGEGHAYTRRQRRRLWLHRAFVAGAVTVIVGAVALSALAWVHAFGLDR